MTDSLLVRRAIAWAAVLLMTGASFGCAKESQPPGERRPVSHITRSGGDKKEGKPTFDPAELEPAWPAPAPEPRPAPPPPAPGPDTRPLTHAKPPPARPPGAEVRREEKAKKAEKKSAKKAEAKEEARPPAAAAPSPPLEAALPPPPPPPVPVVASVGLHLETVSLVRYPAIDSPEVMRPGRRDPVLVSLEEERTTPTKVIDARGQPSAAGNVLIDLPVTPDLPDEEAWKVTVQLQMPDAEVDHPVQELLLRKSGPADVATFKVRPTWVPSVPEERRDVPLLATFTYRGKVFARATRMVPVTADPDFKPPDQPASSISQGGSPGTGGSHEDLYIETLSIERLMRPQATPDEAEDRFVFQAQLAGQDETLAGGDKEFLMTGLDAFLVQRYKRLATLGRRSGDPDPDDATRISNADEVRQFGADLWNRYTPEVVKSSLRRLQAIKPSGADIRYQTNDPRFPLELLLVPIDGVGDCGPGARCELLGVLHRVSRWHSVSALGVRPGIRTRIGTIAMVAPSYASPLEAVDREREALKRLAGDRFGSVSGTFAKFVASLQAPPFPAVLHYAGHGSARPGALLGLQQYALRLEDREVNLATFQQHTAWTSGGNAGGPLLFLNACQVGQASGAYGWVEGWGPAALELGAAGFIGGLWELGDAGAEGFAEKFYAKVLAGMPVAEAMRQVRSEYAASAYPTYAAYVYYGHPELRLASPP